MNGPLIALIVAFVAACLGLYLDEDDEAKLCSEP